MLDLGKNWRVTYKSGSILCAVIRVFPVLFNTFDPSFGLRAVFREFG